MDVSLLRTTSFDNVDNFAELPYSESSLQKSILPPVTPVPSPVSGQPACDRDALEAIKLDPAILEAQMKVCDISHHQVETKPQAVAVVLPPAHQNEVLKRDPSRASQRQSNFEDMMGVTKAALFSLKPQQFDLLLQFVATLRQQRLGVQKCLECAFCKRNGESVSWYSSHVLKDGRGRIRCPVLRSYRCPKCGATGDHAHTIKYCQSYDA